MTLLFKLFVLLAIFITGCQTNQAVPVAQKKPDRVLTYTPKYKAGSCVVFDQTKINMKSDGTPMKILMINGSVYTVIIIHERVEGEVFFTAIAQKFDEHTKLAKCSSALREW